MFSITAISSRALRRCTVVSAGLIAAAMCAAVSLPSALAADAGNGTANTPSGGIVSESATEASPEATNASGDDAEVSSPASPTASAADDADNERASEGPADSGSADAESTGATASPEDSAAGAGDATDDSATHYDYPVPGDLLKAYTALGGPDGSLGQPTGNAVEAAGGSWQAFRNGALYSKDGQSHVVHGGILTKYYESGMVDGQLGYPTSDEYTGLNDGGASQVFEHGQIHWAPGIGAWITSGAIQDRWRDLSWQAGIAGYPLGDATPSVNGGVYQIFQHGTMYWKANAGAHFVHDGSFRAYRNNGFERGPLGYPTSEETPTRDGGIWQSFENGTI
ncbi:N-acetylmuramoyl-L-alanine amidase [Bifidobacterium sp. DSM 109958]|uniref:N-acetylmuramoyl-L-alanine amidase n=2 Tax=Bifidobacterium moraviense TaxID=2675323 RepID=A0A7Y0F4C4_9BIFI|nr:N-acetylmuramoyl-L-alanine amidase [Bifidobacterium sp. DSM 109958]